MPKNKEQNKTNNKKRILNKNFSKTTNKNYSKNFTKAFSKSSTKNFNKNSVKNFKQNFGRKFNKNILNLYNLCIFTKYKKKRPLLMYKKEYLILRAFYRHIFKNKIKKILLLSKIYLKKINIKSVRNNFFCSLIDLKRNKTLYVSSSGVLKIKVSKQKLKRYYLSLLNVFFNRITHFVKNLNRTFFNVSVPIEMRAKICRIIKLKIYSLKPKNSKPTNNVVVYINPKKCFNGCRQKKEIRLRKRLQPKKSNRMT